jgi:hypothetical protein
MTQFLPDDENLPFFAYGLFKPGQIAFFQISDFVDHVIPSASVQGDLRIRDGLLILNSEGKSNVHGSLITFKQGQANEAYLKISQMEPQNLYSWGIKDIDCQKVNILFGRSPNKGSDPCFDQEWDGWNDPLFEEAMEVITEELGDDHSKGLFHSLFRLQMAYLLLWSSIERFCTLRFGLGSSPVANIKRLAGEPAFEAALKQEVDCPRKIFRADKPKDPEILTPDDPLKSIEYYYQVRCNVTHRGKGSERDLEIVQRSLTELLKIFRRVLIASKTEAEKLAQDLIS